LILGVTLALGLLLEGAATLWLGPSFVRGRYLGNNWKAVGRLDRALGWANRPGATGHIHDGNIDYRVRINREGFRDPERSLVKPAGSKRIVVLGDSVTWGWGVDNGERYTDLLEARLGPGVEVINLAVPGYGTDQHYWNLERNGWSYEPDLVLYCVVMNDLFEAQTTEQYGMLKPRFVLEDVASDRWRVERPAGMDQIGGWRSEGKHAYQWLLAHSALAYVCTGRALDPGEVLDLDAIPYHDPGDQERALVAEASHWIVAADQPAHHALQAMAEACQERGVPLVVTSVAHKHDRYLYEPRFPRPEAADSPEFQSRLTQALVEASQSLALQVLPIDGVMLSHTLAGERLHVGDGHPNRRGHEVIAEGLEPGLREILGRPQTPIGRASDRPPR